MPAPGPTRKPAEDRRREIAEAALRVVASGGLGRFTSLAVAREVGVSDAALFRHFPSMDAIVDAAIDRVEEILFEGFPPQAADPVDRLGAFFRRRVEAIRFNPGVSRLVATDELAKAGSAAAAARVAGFRRRSTEFVRACLEEAEGRGLLGPGVRAEEASVIVLGALLALAHATTAPPPAALPAIAARVWSALETFLRGPVARPQSAGDRPPRPSGRKETRRRS
ncbi:MAG TPA: TetR/AcrR family transcriptional regulator [Anaeromyxobacter sp.]|nr:TetR/AcrR family transcriptional regulator [Anaeromyxobacter sp.]